MLTYSVWDSRIAVVFSIQTWLGESEDSQKSGGTPGYFSVGMSGMFFPLRRSLEMGAFNGC